MATVKTEKRKFPWTLILTLLVLCGAFYGLRLYLQKARANLYGNRGLTKREFVAATQRYERLRKERPYVPDAGPAKAAGGKANGHSLAIAARTLFVGWNTGAFLRLGFKGDTTPDELQKLKGRLEGACLQSDGAPQANCPSALAVDAALAAQILACPPRADKVYDERGVRLVPLTDHRLHLTDDTLRVSTDATGAIAEVLDVLWNLTACQHPEAKAAVPPRISSVYVISEDHP